MAPGGNSASSPVVRLSSIMDVLLTSRIRLPSLWLSGELNGERKMSVPNPEQTNPSHQQQEDGYSRGVDLVTLLAGEFGVSQIVIAHQLRQRGVEVTVDDVHVKPDKNFRIPYEVAKGKTITVVGRDLHFRMKFQG
jgi:hypothetical protein